MALPKIDDTVWRDWCVQYAYVQMRAGKTATTEAAVRQLAADAQAFLTIFVGALTPPS